MQRTFFCTQCNTWTYHEETRNDVSVQYTCLKCGRINAYPKSTGGNRKVPREEWEPAAKAAEKQKVEAEKAAWNRGYEAGFDVRALQCCRACEIAGSKENNAEHYSLSNEAQAIMAEHLREFHCTCKK